MTRLDVSVTFEGNLITPKLTNMYTPRHFEESDQARIIELVNKYAFATLVTVEAGLPSASHLPLMLENDEQLNIVGHMARANDQWQHFQADAEVLVMFQGPHAYISPSNYEGAGVPTWNYASVHMYGVARLIEDENRLKAIIESLSHKYEKSQASPWVPDYPDRMLNAIVGFEIEVSRIEAKYKLSQNRPDADRQNIIANLSASSDTSETAIARLMQENNHVEN